MSKPEHLVVSFGLGEEIPIEKEINSQLSTLIPSLFY
jgi:hypothetical protein